jgi:hypothetical protein
MSRLLRSLSVALAGLLLAAPVAAQRFFPDDPLLVDRDDLDVPEPGEVELSGGWDMIENSFGFGTPPAQPGPRASNVNTLGEVPESSWFTNRIGVRQIGPDELKRGPDSVGPPRGRWTVIRGKSEGVTPGFTIRDERGLVYFVKFDPPEWPNLASSADVIGTKIFHAIGYNVPENYIARLRRDRLELAPDARISRRGQGSDAMTSEDIDAIFSRVHLRDDGTVRVVASLALEGRPLGPHKWFGTRSDDANDVFPHEDRREIRGYRVFCAWINHDDSRAINSLDMYVEEGGRRFVRHYLIDFASALGSGSTGPQGRRAGNEYLLDWRPFVRAALTLGIWDRAWRDVEYPDYPEIGRFESDFFQPEKWKPEHPNAAFQRMNAEDAFWAARIVSRFDDAAVRAIVETGELDDPEAESYLVRTLIERRDKIVAHWLTGLAPLGEFAVEAAAPSQRLSFANLGENAGLGQATGYRYEWFEFDNLSQARTPITGGETAAAAIAIPDHTAEYMVVRIVPVAPERPRWEQAVEVFLTGAPRRLVGIEREY